jgi:hypothetical protein
VNGPEPAAGTLLTVARALRPDRGELLVDGERGDGLVEVLALAAARVAAGDRIDVRDAGGDSGLRLRPGGSGVTSLPGVP